MKKNALQPIVYLLLLVVFAVSCELETEVVGDGNVTTNRRYVSSFSRLEIDGILNVYLKQADEYKVEVKTDENLQEIVLVDSEDDILKIYTNTSYDFEATEMNVYISTPAVEEVSVDGVTAFYVKEQFNQNDLYVEKKNTGNIYLNAVCQSFTLITDGVGDVDLIGSANDAVIDNAMVGNLYAYEFIANNMIFTQASTGDAQINVQSRLAVEFTGVGDVYCQSAPETIEKTGDGTGHLYIEE